MTTIERCDHGELWAVCRECIDGDPYRAPGTDEEPWTLELRAQRQRSGRIAALAFLAIAVGIALIAWRTA